MQMKYNYKLQFDWSCKGEATPMNFLASAVR